MANIQQYLNRITSLYANKPRFNAWVSALLEMVNPAQELSETMHTYFDPANAVGRQLDTIGKLVGRDRNASADFINAEALAQFDDESYRRLIQTKIVANQWKGNNGTIESVWDGALGDALKASYHDNQDMTITVDLTGNYRPIDIELVLRGYIVPKPMGVGMSVNLRTESVSDAFVRVRSGYIGVFSRSRINVEP